LTDGTSLTGDIVSFNDDGVIFRGADDKYTERIPWTKFSQDALKLLARDPKIELYAEPFIETPPPAPAGGAKVYLHKVERLELPPKQSVIGALFSSSVGIVIVLLIYAANIYAGFEVALFRARPTALVAGVSAVAPIIGPVIFLAMPVPEEPVALEEQMGAQAAEQPVTPAEAAPAAEAQPGEPQVTAAPLRAADSSAQTQVFQRGQFTFNRRFMETKFAGFFGVVRLGAAKDMVLHIKTSRANLVAERITRISANEAHFDVVQGAARQEVMVPFADILEIRMKHKDS